jgi:hypothetical protein
MPVKWKIFFALNFVLSLPALVFLILLFINLLNSHTNRRDYSFVFIFSTAFLLITMNGFLNIFLLQRFFPDKLIPAGIKRTNTISLVLNILVSVGTLVFWIYGATLLFRSDYEMVNASGKIALAIIFFLWLVQVGVLIMQGQLPGVISRNNRERMDSLINSIGQ